MKHSVQVKVKLLKDFLEGGRATIVYLTLTCAQHVNANLSLSLPKSTCDVRKPSIHEEDAGTVTNPRTMVRNGNPSIQT